MGLAIKSKNFPFHPILFTLFQILSVYSININEVSGYALLIVLIAVLLMVGIVMFILFKMSRLNNVYALLFSIYIFLFFSYGRILDVLMEHPIFGFNLGRNRYLLFIYIVILLAVTFGALQGDWTKKIGKAITRYLNMFSAGLVIISLGTSAINYDWIGINIDVGNPGTAMAKNKIDNQKYPDVYYLIFDSYTNDRILREYYSWNDSSFVRSLRNKGFRVNSQSFSNYCFTGASICSMLSMRYIHEDPEFSEAYNQANYIAHFYTDNKVMDRFRAEGYSIVTNLGGSTFPKNSKSSLFANNFIQLMVHLSFARIFEQAMIMNSIRQEILDIIDAVKVFRRQDKPTFMILHITAPHAPFVFNADGSRVKYFQSSYGMYEDKKSYVDQVKFIGREVVEIADSLQKHDPNSVIFLQSDHGYGGMQDDLYLNRNSIAARNGDVETIPPEKYIDARFGNLNAVYVPPGVDFPTIVSLVNTFRNLFNAIFGDQYTELPNKAFFTVIKEPYHFHDVTNILDKYVFAEHDGPNN